MTDFTGGAGPSPKTRERVFSPVRKVMVGLGEKLGATKDFFAAPNPPPKTEAQASTSVRAAMADLSAGPVTAKDFLARLCEQHPDYIGGNAGSVAKELRSLANSDGQQRLAADQWVERARPLFHTDATRWLNTRLIMLALALLDADLFQLLSSRECFVPLFEEIAAGPKARVA